MFDHKWEEWHRVRDSSRYPSEGVTAFVNNNFGKYPREQVRFLDLGCGQGVTSWFLAREGYNVTAIDASPAALGKMGRRFLDDNLPMIDMRVGDITNLPFPDGSFNCVIDIMAIYCLPLNGVRQAISEAYRVLAPYGVMYSRMPADTCSSPFLDSGTLVSEWGARELFKKFRDVKVVFEQSKSEVENLTQYILYGRKFVDAGA